MRPEKCRMAVDGDPGVLGPAGARGDDEAAGVQVLQFGHGRGVVAGDADLRPQLRQVLNEVVGEGIVVVDHDHHGGSSLKRWVPG